MILETHFGKVELYQELPDLWTAQQVGGLLRVSAPTAMDAVTWWIIAAQKQQEQARIA